MALLPEPSARREPLHRRTITIQGFRRDDGLFEVEGHLLDRKDIDFKLASGVRAAGEPIHSMWLRLTFDRELRIMDAHAATEAMPYVNECDLIAPDYRQLVGLTIRPGYHQKLKELFGGVRGCTHITELAGALATAAFQTLAGQRTQDAARLPFQLDRCHALATTSPVVARYYPQWYRGNEQIAAAPEPDRH